MEYTDDTLNLLLAVISDDGHAMTCDRVTLRRPHGKMHFENDRTVIASVHRSGTQSWLAYFEPASRGDILLAVGEVHPRVTVARGHAIMFGPGGLEITYEGVIPSGLILNEGSSLALRVL